MKKVTESTTPETIINQISNQEIPGYRASLRKLMDGYFLHCANGGINPEPAYCAFMAVDELLEKIYDYNQTTEVTRQAAGM